MSIEITYAYKDVTAWDKDITFTYEGENYSALLHWDENDGYTLYFRNDKGLFINLPEWVWEYDDFNGKLDELSDQLLEGESK